MTLNKKNNGKAHVIMAVILGIFVKLSWLKRPENLETTFKRDMILVETHHVRYISLGSDVNKLNQVCTSV